MALKMWEEEELANMQEEKRGFSRAECAPAGDARGVQSAGADECDGASGGADADACALRHPSGHGRHSSVKPARDSQERVPHAYLDSSSEPA